ncbi:MAG: protein alpha-tubulin suppressor [Myxococcaceae bacterium]|nr:protein alpha-tubulin suppressor [Myxococcaceae bacterium]
MRSALCSRPQFAQLLLSLSVISVGACSEPECMANERKVGATCYPLTPHKSADAGSASDSGAPPNDRADGSVATTTQLRDGSSESADVFLDGSIAPRELDASQVVDGSVPDAQAGPSLSAIGLASGFGEGHACAVLSTGEVKCWGRNLEGQLGQPPSDHLPPTIVPSLPLTIQVVTGTSHTCALHAAGDVSCWGDGRSGQLADGKNGSTNLPTVVVGLGSVAQLVAAGDRTCALTKDGRVRCWGNGVNSATQPTTLSSVTKLALGTNHACALVVGGSIRCWGGNDYGQLGNGSGGGLGSNQEVPVAVLVPTGAVATDLVAGGNNTCALFEGGPPLCWGSNEYGQMGRSPPMYADTPESWVATPTQIASVSSAKGMSVDYENVCALLLDGTVKCWGRASFVPTLVPGVGDAVELGSHGGCVRLARGSVSCWGSNQYGRLGNGNTTDSKSAMPVLNVP